MRARAERVERSFAHCLDRGGMRRVWLRGEANIEKRYIIHVAGFNLGLLMRGLFGVGTPKGWKKSASGLFLWFFALGSFFLVATYYFYHLKSQTASCCYGDINEKEISITDLQ